MTTSLSARVAAATPHDRNRYADFLRVAAITVVVLGHWLLAVVWLRDGELQATHLLAAVPATQWLTWVFQVMPIFFFVGGYANAAGWSSARARGIRPAAWVRSRGARLLTPVVPLLLLWVPVAPLLAAAGVRDDLVRLATQAALVPAWFLAVYLVVVALVPLSHALHRRHGVRVLVVVVAAAALTDVLHRSGIPVVGWGGFLWVWGAVHQAGYFWHDGSLRFRPATGLALAAAGFSLLALLTGALGYPVSMVGVDGAARTNTTPPSVAILALAIAQVGLVALARRPAERLLSRPRVWAAVAFGGGVAMSVYLWHMSVLVLVSGVAATAGLLPGAPVDATWWAARPLWYAALLAALAPVVAIAAPVERGSRRPCAAGAAPSALVTGVGVAATAAGIGLLAGGGLQRPGSFAGLPLAALALAAAGLAVLVGPPRELRSALSRGQPGGDRKVEIRDLAPVGHLAAPVVREGVHEQQSPSGRGLR